MNKDVRCAISMLLLAFGGFVPAEAATRWDNPLPQGNVIEGVAWNGERFVAVGNSGTLLVKEGAGNWRLANSGTTEWLKSVRWTGNQFVAVGNTGTVLISPDGESWTRRSSGGRAHLYGVEYAPELGRLVAVGEGGTVITSQDGTNWTRRISNAGSGWLNDVAWNGSLFVAVGGSGTIIYSADGLSWDRSADLQDTDAEGVVEGPNLQGIAWSGGRWVAVAADSCDGGRCTYASANGRTWGPEQENPGEGLWAVIGHATGFVAVGNDWNVIYSGNGDISWVQATSGSARQDLTALAMGGMNLVAAGQHGLILEADSPVGPWARSGSSAGELSDLNAVAASAPGHGSSYVAVGAGVLLYKAVISEINTVENPAITVIRNSLQGPLPVLRDVAWAPGGYVAVGGVGGVFSSELGDAWSQDPSAGIPQVELHGVARVDDRWFVLGAGGTVLSKIDGGAWEELRTGDELLRGIAATGSELIVVGRAATGTSGVILRGSTTGGAFTRRDFPGADLKAIAANGNGQYVAVGADGAFLTGDGESWQQGVIDARFDLTDVVWDGVRYIVVGDGGHLGNRGNTFTSTDGHNWERQTLSGNRLNGVAVAGTTIVAVGEGGTIVQKACPCAVDDHARTTRNTSVQVAVLANDIGEALFIAGFDARTAQGGTVRLAGSRLAYTPPRDFAGTDSFDYAVGSRTDAGQDVATVTVAVDRVVSGTAGNRGGGGGGGSVALELLSLALLAGCRRYWRRV